MPPETDAFLTENSEWQQVVFFYYSIIRAVLANKTNTLPRPIIIPKNVQYLLSRPSIGVLHHCPKDSPQIKDFLNNCYSKNVISRSCTDDKILRTDATIVKKFVD